jgi:hypothetical protein
VSAGGSGGGRYDLSLLTPSDAAVAVRSFARRFRELAERAKDDPAIVRSIERLEGEAASVLAAAAGRLGESGSGADLEQAAEALATGIGEVSDWEHGDELQVVREAVQAGSAKVREAERLLPEDD